MLWRIPADTHEQRIGTMFNLPTNIRLPGFRVGLPDDPPGQNTETVPGFAVPALGYDPDGNAIQTAQATGLGSASFDPQGLVPVNCTSADGSTSCMTPGGKSFTEPPQGFPARVAPDVENHHYYHFQSEPLTISAEKLLQAIIANPTPSFFFGRPATPQGTLNEATPDWANGPFVGLSMNGTGDMPLGPLPVTPSSPVTSYVTKDKDGNAMVVNLTQPGHALSPGYAVLYVTTSGGVSTIHVEGEGQSFLQAPDRPEMLRKFLNDDTWRDYFKTIVRRAQ
jgi:hypothetical protein